MWHRRRGSRCVLYTGTDVNAVGSNDHEVNDYAWAYEDDAMAPQSLIREDDIEIYTRAVSYRNKVSRVVNKFMSRLKWMPLQHRFEIFERAHQAFLRQK